MSFHFYEEYFLDYKGLNYLGKVTVLFPFLFPIFSSNNNFLLYDTKMHQFFTSSYSVRESQSS